MSFSKKIYCWCLCAMLSFPAFSQTDTSAAPILDTILTSIQLKVNSINIAGNKKTKTYLIAREIQFETGDHIDTAALDKELALARQQIYNTTLFSDVTVTAKRNGYNIDVMVIVKERWYIYPIPQFDPVDRNLNEWLVKYKGDLSRVNYGMKFVHFNFTGRRDILRLYLLNGYTRNVAFSYTMPFSSKKLTEGFRFGAGYAQSREIAYKTSSDNKLQFYKNGQFVRNVLSFNAGYSFRPAIRGRHFFSVNYAHVNLDDSIITSAYNPGYLNKAVTSVSLIDLNYTYQYINVNNIVYPLSGVTGYASVAKRGFRWNGGTNMFFLEGGYNLYNDLKKNWYSSLQFTGKIKLPFDQPYLNQRALGYGETNLRGLEYYVVDGAVFGLAKSTLKKKLVAFSIPLPFKSKYFSTLPFAIFAKVFADAGYVYTQKKYDTFLNNKFLYSGGFGIDIVSLYDINLRIEYSFNQLGQKGLFLQTQGGF